MYHFSTAHVPGNFQEVLNHSSLFSSGTTKLLHVLTFCGDEDWESVHLTPFYCMAIYVYLEGFLDV